MIIIVACLCQFKAQSFYKLHLIHSQLLRTMNQWLSFKLYQHTSLYFKITDIQSKSYSVTGLFLLAPFIKPSKSYNNTYVLLFLADKTAWRHPHLNIERLDNCET